MVLTRSYLFLLHLPLLDVDVPDAARVDELIAAGHSIALKESTDRLFRVAPDGAVFVGDHGAFFHPTSRGLLVDLEDYVRFAATTIVMFVKREPDQPPVFFHSFLDEAADFVLLLEDTTVIAPGHYVNKYIGFPLAELGWDSLDEGVRAAWRTGELMTEKPIPFKTTKPTRDADGSVYFLVEMDGPAAAPAA